MALSLGVHSGLGIQVGPWIIRVGEILRGQAIKVQAQDGKEFLITDQQKTEVYPDVFLSYGTGANSRDDLRGTRLAIDAPRSLKITRLAHA